MKKRWIFILAFLLINAVGLVLYQKYFKLPNNVEINMSSSTHYSQQELQEAVTLLRKKFAWGDFSKGTLQEITFDEDKNQTLITDLLESEGKNSVTGNDPDHVLILETVFNTGNPPISGASADSEYHWMWIFQREDADSSWKLISWGI